MASIRIYFSNCTELVQIFKSEAEHDHQTNKRCNQLAPEVKKQILKMSNQELEPARILNLLRVCLIK